MTNTRQKITIPNKSAKPDKTTTPSGKIPTLADELLQLNDDFAEYCEINAFLCHALATALIDHECLNADVISGARRCSNWLQFRSAELKDATRHVHARYVTERKKVSSS